MGRFIIDDYKFETEATHQILAEIDALDRSGVDAVVGMAVYTGKLELGDENSPQA